MILMNDFRAESPELREAMLGAARRVLESGWYVLGNEVITFEKNWAKICGVEYAVGVGNGMEAIEIVLRALGIGSGDEVITTPMTAFATVLAIIRAGAIPVLADIVPSTALLSRESVERCLSPKTKAIILVHLYGQVRDMDAWQTFCTENNVHLVEDCAQAHLATWKGRVAGSFGMAGAYSFYPTKNLGAIGDAGMLVANDEALVKQARRLRNYGQNIRYHHPKIGLNSRLDEIHAAMLLERLKWLPVFTKRRRQIAEAYRAGIQNPAIQHPVVPQEVSAHVYHLYVINCNQRDALQAHLEKFGVQTYCHYPMPVHHQEPCSLIRRDPMGLEVSEKYAKICLSLPCHPQMTDTDVSEVIIAVNTFQER